MNAFGNWLATSWLGGLLKMAAGVALGSLYVALQNGGLGSIDMNSVNQAVTAALIVVTPVIINALNKADGRYGLGNPPPAE